MFTATTWRIAFSFCALLAGNQWLAAQNPVYKPGEYPAPRYPQIKANYTVDDLMPIAREVVRRPVMSAFLKAGYAIQPGQRALIVVPGDFEPLVLDAIIRAIHEAGGEADVVRTHVNHRPGGDGSIEVRSIMGPREPQSKGFTRGKVIQLAETGEYDILIYGAGGPHAPISIPWQYIFWDRIDKFIATAGFPDEIQQAIDLATWEMVLKARRFRVQDPEGTDISWTVKPNYWEEAKETYEFNIVHEGHVSGIPMGMAGSSFMESDAAGVIGGTLNHTGPFPNIRVSIANASASGADRVSAWRSHRIICMST